MTAGEFFGTGFDIGTLIGRNGSEMEVCYYKKGESHLSYFDDVEDETCVTFQNEAGRTSTDVIRSIVGLPEDTYIVGVLNKDNGLSELYNPPIARSTSYPAKLAIDFIQFTLGRLFRKRYNESYKSKQKSCDRNRRIIWYR